MKLDQRKETERLYTALGDLDPAAVEAARHYRPKQKGTARSVRRIVSVALAATLLLAVVTLTVFAAVPSLRGIINLPFLAENAQKDTVPEGWIGVYTVSDLNKIRDDLDGKYILMNDITFTEADGPFTPIGTSEESFMGQMDGNGYVIRGLVIEVTQAEPPVLEGEMGMYDSYTLHDVTASCSAVGLFGYCGYGAISTLYNREIEDYNYPYLLDDQPYRGMICNLGVEDARIRVNSASNARVGVIAGQASYVAGCYVKDCTIELNGYESKADSSGFFLRMGGIAGSVQVLDSCYAKNCSLNVTGTDHLLSDGSYVIPDDSKEGVQFDKATVFIGGLAGNAYTAVTSYAEGGEILCDYAANRQREWWWDDSPAYMGDLFGHVHRIPCVMNEYHYKTIKAAFYRGVFNLAEDEPLPENWSYVDCNGKTDDQHFLYGKFRSYFIQRTAEQMVLFFGLDMSCVNPSMITGDFAWDTEMYLFDTAARMEDVLWLEDVAIKYIGEEKFADLVSMDNLKVGPLYCRALDPNTAYTREDFAEFNFNTVWKMKDGRPVLRIFG